MSTADSLYQNIGALSLPISLPVEGTTLDLDPSRHRLIELFATAINAELGTAWTQITNQLPAGHPLKGKSVVQDKLELPPTGFTMKERKPEWPLLALHRDGTGVYEQHTLTYDKLTQPWQLHYVVGPLDTAGVHKLGDVCIAVAKIVKLVIKQRGHKSYEDGAVQWMGTGVSAIDLKSHEGPGPARFAGDDAETPYLAITMALETVELAGDNTEAFPDYAGTSFDIGLGGSDGTIHGLLYAEI